MKLILIVINLILFLSINAQARQSYEAMAGALTQHFIVPDGASKQFDNRVSEDGSLIANPMLAVRSLELGDYGYTSKSIFAGQNSIGELMGGIGASTGLRIGRLRSGLAIGGYLQDDQKFRDRGIQPFSLWTGTKIGITPIFGVEFSIDQKLTDHSRASIYTLVTPAMSVSLIGIGWDI